MVWVLIAVALGILFLSVMQYNSLVRMRQLTRNAWSDVDVYLKRRADLIPNLVAAVKGYAGHEQNTLEGVIDARNQAAALHSPTTDKQAAEGQLSTGIVRVFALAESYPDLKASDTFLSLQKELTETERLVASARQYYNACVRDYNTMLETFPSAIFATAGGFKAANFFEVETPLERDAPSAKI